MTQRTTNMKSKNSYDKALNNVMQDKNGNKPSNLELKVTSSKEQKLRSGKEGNLGKKRADMK